MVLQHHKFLGGISELLWTELGVCWSTGCGVWTLGCHVRSVDHHTRSFRSRLMFSFLWCKLRCKSQYNSLIAESAHKGQYHFVFILAPKKTRRFASFVIGWMNLLAWSICTCSGISVFVASVAGLASFLDNSFVATPGQLYLMYLATALISGKYDPKSLRWKCELMTPQRCRCLLALDIYPKFCKPASFYQ